MARTFRLRTAPQLLGAACFMALIVAPAPADAAEYCVHAAADPCTGQIDKGNDLQAALDAAAADEADDTIHLGPGEYLAPTGQAFDYDAPFLGPTGGELHIVGSGSGSGGTLLKADDGNIVYTLSIQSQAKTLVENLAIAVPNGSHGGQNVGVAMVGSAGSQTSIHVLDGVAIKFPANPSVGSGPLVGAYLQNATFRNGTATGPVPSSVPMTGVSSAGNDLVEDATIKAGTAVYMQSEGTARRIDATGDKGFELVSHSGAGEFTVEDVLWRPPTGETGIVGLDAGCGSLAGIQVTLRNATFWATPGSGGSTSISCAPASSHAHLDIDSSILGGGGKAILIGTGPDVTVGVSYSNFDPATIQAADPADVQQGSGNTNLTPGFVGATDFHLGSGSLLLDKGNPAALASGESTTDLAGNPRVVQACTAPPARRDMGAYEYQTPPPGTCDGTDNVTVTFDSAGGSSVAPATVPLGTAVTKPTNPTRSGYTFQGWFTAASGGSEWDFSDPVPASMTLYARWELQHFSDWRNVSAGEKHTCGVRNNGKLYCWGSNTLGQLGFASGNRNTPTRVTTNTTWTSASAGTNHSCGIRNGGELYCWGNNSQGELGLGNTDSPQLPTRVGISSIWKSVSAGEDYTCGVKSNGTLYCWGGNTAGRLGDGTEAQRTTPKRIGTATDWKTVSASRYEHTCGIRGGGTLYCWGHNHFGQLGDGSTSKRTSPTRIGTFTDWAAVSPGSSHTCGVRRSGQLYCWGQNGYGQVGIGATSERELTPQGVGTLADWVGIGAGYAHSCGVRANGKLYCWGRNVEGQMGNGSEVSPWKAPTRVGDLSGSKIASGDNHNCAIRVGELYCWGDSGSGRVGSPTAANPQRTPIRI